MAITKLGRELIKEAGGANPAMARVAEGFGWVGRTGMPALMAGMSIAPVVSGDQSIGGAAGELAGGLAGWELGTKARNLVWKNDKYELKNPFTNKGAFKNNAKFLGRGALGFGLSFLGANILGSMGEHLGDKLMPIWKRQAPQIGQPYTQQQQLNGITNYAQNGYGAA